MKIISIDLETTGLNAHEDQILEIGAICFDDSNPEFSRKYFRVLIWHERLSGNPVALSCNAQIIKEMLHLGKEKCATPENAVLQFYNWLLNECGFVPDEHGRIRITVVGKNYAMFDHNFIKRLLNFHNFISVRRRVLDPSAFYSIAEDTEIPDLELCKSRSNLFEDNTVKHNALDDAEDVVKLWLFGIKRSRLIMSFDDEFCNVLGTALSLNGREIKILGDSMKHTIETLLRYREEERATQNLGIEEIEITDELGDEIAKAYENQEEQPKQE